MKKIIWLSLFCMMLTALSYAATIRVDLAGNGDVLSIQAGIDLAVNGDTVLVNDGIYPGNIRIDRKSISLCSLYIVDGDTTHISQTIIDGDDATSGMIVTNCSGGADTLRIIGFTIRNCRSNWSPITDFYTNGGGIGILFSTAIVKSCFICYNRAYVGGGISVLYSIAILKGNEIFKNVAIDSGGGVNGRESTTQIIYDDLELNSIYLNTSPTGCDISYGLSCISTSVYLDKGSVANADPYFYYCIIPMPINVNQAVITQVNHDLWVCPNGNDDNDGFSSQTPLKTIAFALAIAHPVVGTPITVHLMPGTYSWSQNGNPLPLQPKSYVNIIGTDENSVILDAENYGCFLIGRRAPDYWILRNIKMWRGYSSYRSLIEIIDPNDDFLNKVTVDNIEISDSWALDEAIRVMSCHDLSIDNLIVRDSQVGKGLFVYCYEYFSITNSMFQRLQTSHFNTDNSSCTGAQINKPLSASEYQGSMNIYNCLFTDIDDTSEFWPNVPSGLNIRVVGGNCEVNVVNCTIANNTSITQSGGLQFDLENCHATVVNTIVSGNEPYEVSLTAYSESSFADVTFTNSLVTGGDNSIYTLSGPISYDWGTDNIFGTPGFVGSGIDPYNLSEGSDCINAGTSDTSGYSIPPMDLAGNYRIWDNIIDMGCYEYGSEPYVSVEDPEYPPVAETTLLQIYPNPFRYFTTLSYTVGDAGSGKRDGKSIPVDISVYNLKGQKIKTITHKPIVKSEQVTYWDGRDEQGKDCSTGIYIVKLMVNGKAVSSRKVTLVK